MIILNLFRSEKNLVSASRGAALHPFPSYVPQSPPQSDTSNFPKLHFAFTPRPTRVCNAQKFIY